MKRLVILLLLVLSLAGGGGAAWWFLLRDAGDEVEGTAEEEEPTPDFVAIDPFKVPVMRNGRVIRLVSVIIVLDVKPDGSNRLVYKYMRRLKDAYLSELYSLLGRRFVWESGNVQTYIRRRLKQVSEDVLGPGVVQNVLIQGMESVPGGT